ARAAALSQGVLRAMLMTKLKMIALVLFVVSILGSGAGVIAQQSLAGKTEQTQTAEGTQPPTQAKDGIPPNRDTPGRANAEDLVAPEEDKVPPAQDKGGKEFDPPRFSGTVVRVDRDGKGLGLE